MNKLFAHQKNIAASREEGFTFLEVLMTISIMGILASMPIASGIQQHKAATQDVVKVEQHQSQIDDLLTQYGMGDDNDTK